MAIIPLSLPDTDCTTLARCLRNDPLTRTLPLLVLGSKHDPAPLVGGIIKKDELFTGKPGSPAFLEVIEKALSRGDASRREPKAITHEHALTHVLEQRLAGLKEEMRREQLFRNLRAVPFSGADLNGTIEAALAGFESLIPVDGLVFFFNTLSHPMMVAKLSQPATAEYRERLVQVVESRANAQGRYVDFDNADKKFFEPSGGSGAPLSGDILFYGEPLGEGLAFRGFVGLSVSHVKDRKEVEKKLELFRAFSRQAFTSIENAYLQELFGRLSTVDALTQVSNRHRVIELLKKELVRAKRYFLDLSVMLFDIDNFKTINDFYGYQVGDVILKDLAAITIDTMRSIDEVGRYGGEEFLVVLPETNLKNAQIAAGRIKSRVAGHVFPGIAKDIKISLSIGITSYLRDVDISVDDMLRRADQSLCEAKKKGKNCVHVVSK